MTKRIKRQTWILLFCVLGALILTYCIRTLYIISADPARAFDEKTPAPQRTQASVRQTPTPVPTLTPEEALYEVADTDFMKDRVNILLVGFDQSPEREDEDESVYRGDKNNYRSDVLMLAAVDFERRSLHLISIPRDTYTPIYNKRGRWKINAAFAKGGAAEGEGFLYAVKTVEMLMGVPIAHYAGVNMEGMKRLVDAIGGVDYDVDVKITLNGRVLEKGFQHLNGQQALDYCRARKGISTDVGRNDRQQRMLFAIFEQMQQTNTLTSIPRLYDAVSDDIYTDLSAAQIAALAAFALKLDQADLKRSTLDGEYVSNVYNASYYVLRNKSLIALIKEEFGVTIKRDKKYDLATVKRDKAAAEAKKAAESLPDVETMLLLPADATGDGRTSLLESARASRELLLYAIENDASETEIRRRKRAFDADVARLLRAFGIESGVPKAFSRLVPAS